MRKNYIKQKYKHSDRNIKGVKKGWWKLEEILKFEAAHISLDTRNVQDTIDRFVTRNETAKERKEMIETAIRNGAIDQTMYFTILSTKIDTDMAKEGQKMLFFFLDNLLDSYYSLKKYQEAGLITEEPEEIMKQYLPDVQSHIDIQLRWLAHKKLSVGEDDKESSYASYEEFLELLPTIKEMYYRERNHLPIRDSEWRVLDRNGNPMVYDMVSELCPIDYSGFEGKLYNFGL